MLSYGINKSKLLFIIIFINSTTIIQNIEHDRLLKRILFDFALL